MMGREANSLGRIDGTAAAENLLDEEGLGALRDRLTGLWWRAAAERARAHEVAGVPDELRETYYGAYARAALDRARTLVWWASKLADTEQKRATPSSVELPASLPTIRDDLGKLAPLLDPITRACQVAGGYILSVGTWNPAVVLGRLLDALSILDPDTHRRLRASEGEDSHIPPEALEDELHEWWSTARADEALRTIFEAMNRAAPEGFHCMVSENARVELKRMDAPDVVEDMRFGPPSQSALRARVRR